MTRAEIRIRAAEKRAAKAREAMSRIVRREMEEDRAHEERQWSRRQPARKALIAAETALLEARLAACGIVPMETIVEQPATRRSPAILCVVRLCRVNARLELLPVGKAGRVLRNRLPLYFPSDLTRLRVTGRRAVE